MKQFARSIWLPISFLVVVFLCVTGLLVYAVNTDPVYDEPTSRCIDTKYRIFERGKKEGFSVVEDNSCAQ